MKFSEVSKTNWFEKGRADLAMRQYSTVGVEFEETLI